MKNTQVMLDGTWQVNTAVRYALTSQLTLSAYVNNLLDEERNSSVKTTVFQDGLPSRGRTYALGLELLF